MKRAFLFIVVLGAAGAIAAKLFGLPIDQPHSGGPTYDPAGVQAAVKRKLRDPESAQFGRMSVHGDRKWAGSPVTVVCGSVNARNGFGGYVGSKDFVYIKERNVAEIDSTSDNSSFVKTWNDLCAGKHSS